jgi:hypothetical protein
VQRHEERDELDVAQLAVTLRGRGARSLCATSSLGH